MTLPEYFFDPGSAFAHPVTRGATGAIAGLLAVSLILILALHRAGRISDDLYHELRLRWLSWLALVPLLVIPILLGALPVMLMGCVLSLLCYREFSRATGLFRHRSLETIIFIGILAENFAIVDHYYRLFVALWPLTVGLIALTAVLADRPRGYLQRVSLAALGFSMFGCWLGHFTYFANDRNYRAILLWMLLGVELNDVFAYLCGRLLGKRKLCPNTSPNKTVAGAVGAVLLTTPLAAGVGHFVFLGQALDTPVRLLILGLFFSVLGQFGDLLLSSIKRDLGIKDTGAILPGHGGLLDRFDSLLLVAPACFHLINYLQGIGADRVHNIITGALGNP